MHSGGSEAGPSEIFERFDGSEAGTSGVLERSGGSEARPSGTFERSGRSEARAAHSSALAVPSRPKLRKPQEPHKFFRNL